MRWNSSEYGDIKDIRIPPAQLWKPDILMYNRSVHPSIAVTKLQTNQISKSKYINFPPPLQSSVLVEEVSIKVCTKSWLSLYNFNISFGLINDKDEILGRRKRK